MYNYNLKITIFSKDKKLEDIVRNINPLPNYHHNIARYDNFSQMMFQLSDIVIFNLDNYQDVYFEINSSQKIVFCADRFKDKYQDFSAVILKPINYTQFKYEIEKLLKRIDLEDKRDYLTNCLDATINGMPDMFWIKSLEGIHSLLNDKFCEVVRKDKKDITGKDHYYIWDVDKDDPNNGADLCKQTEDAVIEKRCTLSFYETVKVDKNVKQLVTYKSPLYDKNGQVIGTVGIGHDITDLKNLGIENQIIMNSVPYAMLIKDTDGKIQNVNNTFEEYFNITQDDILEHDYENWKQKTFISETTENKLGYEEGMYTINGEEKHIEFRTKEILDAFSEVSGYICIFRDITLEKELQKQLETNSNIDVLTGLYNRRFLREYISNLNQDEIITLFSIDLDHFKSINDNYGHTVGDEVLKLTADTFKEIFNDDIIVRMGGDEFLVVTLKNEDEETLKLKAENLLSTLMNTYNKDEKLSKLSASIGITQGQVQENEFSTLLQKSDKALYEAKENGRSCYVINLENDMKRKLQKK